LYAPSKVSPSQPNPEKKKEEEEEGIPIYLPSF
jgi:hypothetical protein